MGISLQKSTIELKEATGDDIELVMAWRNNPEIYKGFFVQTDALEYVGHYNYWYRYADWQQWIIYYGEEPYNRRVGQVNVQHLDSDCPEVGYLIGEPKLWGHGVATEAVKQSLDWLKEMGYKSVCARTKQDNIGSQRILEKLGFQYIAINKDNLNEYRRTI